MQGNCSVGIHGYNALDHGKQERILHGHRRHGHIRRCLLSLLVALTLLIPLLSTSVHPSIRSLSLAHAQEPCGGKIAFVRDGSLWIINSDGSGERQLTRGVQHRPSWSPDGKEIAFSAYPQGRIHVINVQTRQLRELVGRPGCWATDPSWSPDGLSIAYYFQCGNTSNDPAGAAVMDTTDGSNSSDLFMNASFPIWSPDGSKIAAHRGPLVPGGEPAPGLYICERDGSPCERLTDRIGSAPSWSPDGQFITQDDLDGIWLFPVNGDPPRKLVKGFYPSWAPDSTRIVFVDVTDGAKIALINVNGTGYQPLTEGNFPAWQPCPYTSLALEILNGKQESISFLSDPKFEFLNFNPAALRQPSSWKNYAPQESKAQALLDSVRAKNEQRGLTPKEASAFYRLKLFEDALQASFTNYAVVTNDWADIHVGVAALALSMIQTAERLTDELADKVPLAKALFGRVKELALDFLQNVSELTTSCIPDPWTREVVRNGLTAVFEYLKAEASQGKSIVELLSETLGRLLLDQAVLAGFVIRTDEYLERAIQKASPESLAATVDPAQDAQAKAAIESIIQQTEADARRAHEQHEALRDKANAIEAATQITDLLALLPPPSVGSLLLQMASISEKFWGGMYIMNSEGFYQQALTRIEDQVASAERQAFDPTASSWLPSANNQDRPPVLKGLASTGLHLASYASLEVALPAEAASSGLWADYLGFQRGRLQRSGDEYEGILQQVLQAVQRGDKDALEKLIPQLLAAERSLSAQFKISQAPVAAASGQAKPQTPSLASSYAQLLSNSTNFDFQSIALYGALIDNLLNPTDSVAQKRTLDQAEAVLASIGAYQQRLDAALPAVAEVKAPSSLVLIASYSVPDEIISGQSFELTAKVVNAGTESVGDVSVRVVGGELVPAEQTVALGKIAGMEEGVVNFQLQPVGSGIEILTLYVLKGDDVLSTQLVCASVVGEPVGSVLTPEESRPPKLPLPCCGLGITSVMVFLLVWLQWVRPSVSS